MEGLLASDSQIHAATIQAYLQTEFHVFGNSPMTLRIGEACTGLADLHVASRVDCSAFITACNPFSAQFSDADNAERQAALALELRRRSLLFVDGLGQHSSNDWLGEPSHLVLGLTLEAAKTLGRRLEQNAIVWSGADVVPQLVLLR